MTAVYEPPRHSNPAAPFPTAAFCTPALRCATEKCRRSGTLHHCKPITGFQWQCPVPRGTVSSLYPLTDQHVNHKSLQGGTMYHQKTFAPPSNTTVRTGYLPLYIDKVLESMFFLAFFSFLRCSDFTLLLSTAIHLDTQLCLTFPVNPPILVFYLKCSKTNQSGLSQLIYLFQ